MATVGSSFLTIADAQSLRDPSGRFVKKVINLLAELTPVFQDGRTAPASHGDRHLITRKVGASAAGTTGPNKGHAFSKSTFAQEWATMGAFSNVVTLDERIVGPNQSVAEIRNSMANGAIEEIAKKVEREFFYGNTAIDPLGFTGLANRYNALPTAANPFSNQVVNGGGVGADNTSIWFVTWGDTQTSFIHPSNTPAGIRRMDKGDQRVTDSDGNPYYVKEEIITKDCGIAIEDYTWNARIANIDVSDAIAGTVDLFGLLEEAYTQRLKGTYNAQLNDANKQSRGRTVLYMNRKMAQALMRLSRNGGGTDNFVRLTPMQLEGREFQSYQGMPIKITDSILNTEALVA